MNRQPNLPNCSSFHSSQFSNRSGHTDLRLHTYPQTVHTQPDIWAAALYRLQSYPNLSALSCLANCDRHSTLMWTLGLKGIVHPQIKILSLLTQQWDLSFSGKTWTEKSEEWRSVSCNKKDRELEFFIFKRDTKPTSAIKLVHYIYDQGICQAPKIPHKNTT